MKIENVVLPNRDPTERFDVKIVKGQVTSAARQSSQSSDPPALLLPALCHPHIHLDKAYLLTSHPKPPNNSTYPDYSDLALESGDFAEALSKTSQAKARYTLPDLVLRGSQLVAESIRAGVTSMRAFVEVDHVTQDKCVEAAVRLKQKFRHACYIQICAFAQDPIMSTDHGDENRKLLIAALHKYSDQIEVLGTTPYVEESVAAGRENIKWAIETAITHKLHLDFHLDYNVSTDASPLIWDVLKMLNNLDWLTHAVDKRICIGHCTRITLFSQREMQKLTEEIADLPVTFVGLPTSDLFMMGRPQGLDDHDKGYGQRERGTLQILDMIQQHGLRTCLGVNNLGNAFTPWGSADPLRLASLGVGIYQAGTAEHARTLYECVSTRAREAIGLQKTPADIQSQRDDFDLQSVDGGGILMVQNHESIEWSTTEEPVPARHSQSVTDVVWDPPELGRRTIIRG